VSKNNEGPDVELLGRIARVTQRRGDHAFGFAWIDGRGRLRSYKQRGRIGDYLALLDMVRDARLLIGHCRYATQGTPDDNMNNHPHPADGGWIVHNGMILNYGALLRRYDLQTSSECDSEVLGLLIENSGRESLAERCVDAVGRVSNNALVLMGLWSRPGRMVAVRRGNPLHTGTTGDAIYLASLTDGLPGTVREVADDSEVEYRWTKSGGAKVIEAKAGPIVSPAPKREAQKSLPLTSSKPRVPRVDNLKFNHLFPSAR
jgi:glucosamine 6-phosphate synthetase-like amidotransferase/phosphosugar isomerase protein